MINILFVNYHSTELIERCLQSLPEPQSQNYQIFIVNNSVDDATIYHLQHEKVQIIESPHNLGFGGACNLGIQRINKQDPGGIIWLLNPDTYFSVIEESHYWNSLESIFQENSDLSLLGTVIVTPEQKPWFSGGNFNRYFGHISSRKNSAPQENHLTQCDWISGCSLMINLKKFATLPYFDTQFFLYYEDLDFCLRYVKQGHQLALTNKITVVHQPSSITDRDVYNKVFHSSFSYLFFLWRHLNRIIFFVYLLKFSCNMLWKFVVSREIGRAKYHGLKKFCKVIFE